MTVIKKGTELRLGSVNEVTPKLKRGCYLLLFDDMMQEFYLSEQAMLVLPSKIYGDMSIVDRWLTKWQNTTKNLGILLSGIKGTGKTITANLLALRTGAPIILVNDSFQTHQEKLKDFLSKDELQGSVIFIDEFEKIFPGNSQQETLLSLLDGIHSTHLLFILTINENRISSYFSNRLNRIHYRREYGYMKEDEIAEVVDDLLERKEYRESIIALMKKLGICTMDILTSVIKEVDLFNEDPFILAKNLNLVEEQLSFEFSVRIHDSHIWKKGLIFEAGVNLERFKVNSLYHMSFEWVKEAVKGILASSTGDLSDKDKEYFDMLLEDPDTFISEQSLFSSIPDEETDYIFIRDEGDSKIYQSIQFPHLKLKVKPIQKSTLIF